MAQSGRERSVEKKGKRSSCRTLGPVHNLEEHVPSDWWRRIFNAFYLKTDGDVVGDERITRSEVDLVVRTLNLSPEDRVLDLCCGQGRHTLALSGRGFRNVEGLDRSHFLIQKAKEQAKASGLVVTFREGDARKLPFPTDRFHAVVILGNSFGYFETARDDLAVLLEVRRVLQPWGRLLIDIADSDFLRKNFQARSWEWIDEKLFVCRERSLSEDGDRLVSREVITHVDKGIKADQFYAERLYSRESLAALLEEAGFSEIAFPAGLTPDSQRNQDLGMMERRVLVTSQVRKDWAPVRVRARQGQRQVTVVLGDPEKADPLKPAAVFDDDDYYTIDRMKAALKELPEYRINFLNRHDGLIQDLQKLVGKTDIVFNLCDEGFLNDPRRELHVPALLEMLGINYSGGGPQCLAFCYDKSLVRGIAKELGIPVPEAVLVQAEDVALSLPFDLPAMVKPNFGDSSFGITQNSVCYSPGTLLAAIRDIRNRFGYEKPILVEELLTGKDLTLGIIGNTPSSYTVLPISEEDYSRLPKDLPQICGYEAKWRPDSPYWKIQSVPADLPESTTKDLIRWSLELFDRLECRDYARFDWRLDKRGKPRLLEVNPNPGWCWDGHLAKMAGYGGISYPEMLKMILRAAEERLGLVPVSSPTDPGADEVENTLAQIEA